MDAQSAIEQWLAGGPSASLYGSGLDFRGVDLSGLYIYEAWLYESDFRGARLEEVDMPSAHLNDADFRGADLTSIVLSNASASGADFSEASILGANLRSIEATGCTFRASRLTGSEVGGSMRKADLRGARLDGTTLLTLSLREASLLGAVFEGARGVVIGPFLADTDDGERLIGGAEAEAWFASRGADLEVLAIENA